MLSPRKHVSSDLKLKILSELSSSGSSVPEVAKRYGLHPKRLYQWRSKANESSQSQQLSPKNRSNFVELLSIPELSCSDLSAQITINNIDLSIKGKLSSSQLLSIIKILGD